MGWLDIPFRSRARLLTLATAIAAALTVTPVAAQTVVGTVTERGSARPLPGTFLVLMREDGTRAGGVLSRPDGGYVLRAPVPGRYRVLAERIGYASTTSDVVELEAGASLRLDIEVPIEAVTLEGIQVATGERCRPRPGSGPATARLWDEARKALEVARWSAAQEALRFQVVRHERELDAATLEVVDQRQVARTGWYDESPYRSISLERLRAGGYVQQTADGGWDYFAPDAAVLLSDEFLDTHCFRVQGPPHDDPDLIGLAFDPVPGRETADISGVLWIERGSAELRRLDFRYHDLPFPHGDWPQVGGRVEFERLSTGMWTVGRWHVRMPHAARRIGGFDGQRPTLELVSLREEGAAVRSITTREGKSVAQATGAAVYGVVSALREGTDGAPAAVEPVAGATVELLGTGTRATTGARGTFRLTAIPAGTYRIRVVHPLHEQLGIPVAEEVVTVEVGHGSELRPTFRLDAVLARDLCRDGGWSGTSSSPALVHGAVVDDEGAPVAFALLRVQAAGPERTFAADSLGRFLFCVDPTPEPLRMAAVETGAVLTPISALDPVLLEVSRPGFLQAPVPLSRPLIASRTASPEGGSWSNAIIGRVIEEGTGRSVPGATVRLRAAAGGESTVVTDSAGRFLIPHPGRDQERFTLEVEHLAYESVTSDVDFRGDEEVRLDVRLATRAIALEPILVTGRRQDVLASVGFYARMERGGGTFVERAEIERRRPSRVTDVLYGTPGVTIMRRGSEADIRLVQQVTFRTEQRTPGGTCLPSIWIDERLARSGGLARVGAAMLSELISPEDVAGIEVYTGAAMLPPQFRGSEAACGVVVIWTRHN